MRRLDLTIVGVRRVKLWDGRTTRTRLAIVDGRRVRVWGYGTVPAGLATRRQLRRLELTPGGQRADDIVWFNGGLAWGWLYRVDLAQPKRPATPAQMAAIARANTARRTCQGCGTDTGRYLTPGQRLCGDCGPATVAKVIALRADRAGYPPDWPAISARIRFDRAKGRCECRGECGQPHSATSPAAASSDRRNGGAGNGGRPSRCRARHHAPHPETGAWVLLATAHLDHDPANCDPANLRAMCQACHTGYDADHHAQTRARTRTHTGAGSLTGAVPQAANRWLSRRLKDRQTRRPDPRTAA